MGFSNSTTGLLFKLDADSSKLQKELRAVDGSFDNLGSKLGSLGGAAAVGAAGIAAIGASALVAGQYLYGLAKGASDYGSMIFDATEKTGLAAETISSMKIAADQSGTSLEAVTGGLAKFAKTIGAAGDGSKEAAAKLAKVGVTSKDLDTALAQALTTIAKYPPGVQQMTAAQAAFGKSGADLLPFIKSFDGDLPALIAKCKELGLTMSDKDARAADEFGDQMDTLNAQLAAVGRTIGMELMPVFKDMAEDMSKWLADNKDNIRDWGQITGDVLRGVSGYWQDATKAAKEYLGLDFNSSNGKLWLVALLGGAGGMAILNRGATDRPPVSMADIRKGDDKYLSTPPRGASDPSGGGSGKATKKLDLPALGSMSSLVISSGNAEWDAWFVQMGAKYKVDPNVLLLQAKTESSFRAGAVSPKGAQGFSQFMPGTAARFNVNTSSVKDSIRGQAQYMAVLLSMFGGDYKEALAGYNAGEGNVQKYGGIPPFKETRNYVSRISSAYAAKVRKGTGGGFGTYDPAADDEKEIKAAALKADRLVEIGQSQTDSLIALEEHWYQRSLELNEPGEAIASAQRIHDLKIELIDGEITALEEKKKKFKEGSDEELEISHQIALKKIERSAAVLNVETEFQRRKTEIMLQGIEEVQRAEQEAFNKRVEQLEGEYNLLKQIRDVLKERVEQIKKERAESRRVAESHDIWDFDKIAEARDVYGAMTDDLKQMTNDTFGSMADAIGQSIAAWALYGDSIGASLKKATAAILANIAAQAITQAVWEIAQGFAMLALAIFGHPTAGESAAGHFKAAAIYGSIGVGAALGAKALSGGGQGASGGGGQQGAGQQQQINQNPQTYSRASENAYNSGLRFEDRGFGKMLNRLVGAIDRMDRKIEGMRPGDVMGRAIKERPGMIGNAAVNDVKRNSGTGRQLATSMGIK